MQLDVMTKEQCEEVRQWRNKDISLYRTPFLLTQEMQEKFYENVICDRDSKSRFYSVSINQRGKTLFLGMVGLVNICPVNRSAEISISIKPPLQAQGFGESALLLLLHEGFKNLNLDNIFGECYECNKAVGFWQHMINKYKAESCKMPKRKYWDGQYFDALYFNFNKDDYYGN